MTFAVAPLKRAVSPGQYGLNTSADSYQDEGTRFIRTSDVTENGELVEGGVSLEPQTVPPEYLLDTGDLLLSRAGTIGRCYRVKSQGNTFAGYLIRFAPKPQVAESTFLEYVFGSKQVMEQIEVGATTNTIANFNAERYANLLVPVPPLAEQKQIAEFLDVETGRIDQLITEYQTQIGLLGEQRTQGISETFADTNSTTIPLRRLLHAPPQYGASESGTVDAPEEWPRYVRITDIGEHDKLRDEIKRLEPATAQPYLLCDGDILFARSGATVGKAFAYQRNMGACAYAGYLIRFRFNDEVLPELIRFWADSSDYWDQIRQGSVQATIENVNAERYKSLLVPVPPKAKQETLLWDLTDLHLKTLAAVSEIETQIESLRELRQALISTAVSEGVEACEAVAS